MDKSGLQMVQNGPKTHFWAIWGRFCGILAGSPLTLGGTPLGVGAPYAPLDLAGRHPPGTHICLVWPSPRPSWEMAP